MTSRSGYDPVHFAAIGAVEERHFWFRARNRVLRTVMAPLRQRLPKGARVLEIGCGTGNVLRVLEDLFPATALVGMDLFAEGLTYARGRTRAALVQGSVPAHPFSKPFHLIGLFDVLEHIDQDDSALRTIRDLLVPGGSLVVTVPAGMHLWSAFDVEAHHCRRYSRSELLMRLHEAGFDVSYISPFMTAIYPLVWLSRRVRRRESSVNATSAELSPPAWLNALLYVGLAPECWVLGAGRRLPFGTSLLAVARRR